MRHLVAACAAVGLFVGMLSAARAQENYESWEPLQSTFESTGGGGIIIKNYEPVVVGDKCATNFTATEPGGKVYYNKVEFEAVPVQGGTLCTNGKWRALDGSMSGTTPLRVFVKDGVRRRSPATGGPSGLWLSRTRLFSGRQQVLHRQQLA
jgi:hypothetical protein